MPTWLQILLLMLLVILTIHPSPEGYRWWQELRRPAWMEGVQAWTPLLWLLIQIGIVAAALLSWQAGGRWSPVTAVILLLLLMQLYPWLLCRSRRLGIGALVCLIGWIYGLTVAAGIAGFSMNAVLALLPYLLWSPLEVWITWRMRRLNRGSGA